jgi:hypothetical protein
MWQHGRAFLCKECHEKEFSRGSADLEAAASCIICDTDIPEERAGKQTCGVKCARTLKRRSERQANEGER